MDREAAPGRWGGSGDVADLRAYPGGSAAIREQPEQPRSLLLPVAGRPTLGDIDSDGDLDAVVASGQGLHVLFNPGNGLLAASHTHWLPGLPGIIASAVALADLDGDGDLDSAVATTATDFFPQRQPDFAYWNDGTGRNTLAPDAIPDFPTESFDIRAGDLDGDGDIAASPCGGRRSSATTRRSAAASPTPCAKSAWRTDRDPRAIGRARSDRWLELRVRAERQRPVHFTRQAAGRRPSLPTPAGMATRRATVPRVNPGSLFARTTALSASSVRRAPDKSSRPDSELFAKVHESLRRGRDLLPAADESVPTADE